MRCLALVCLLASGAVAAQPITLDGEFARALLGVESADGVMAGTAPEAVLPFVPDGATLLGALVRSDDGRSDDGPSVTALARLGATPEAAAEAYRERSVEGWEIRRPTMPPDPVGGFASTDAPSLRVRFVSADDERRVAHVQFQPRPEGGTLVSISLRDALPFETASREASGDAYRSSMDALQATLPLLTPPEGAVQRSGGGGGSGSSYHGHATLDSDLSPEAIAAHYAALMEAEGWAPVGAMASDAYAAAAWTKEHEGDPLLASFLLSRPENGRDRMTIVVARSR